VGGSAFIRPIFLRPVVSRIRDLGGVPFLTDSNTLYTGTRSDSVSHLHTAELHGFTYSVVNAPVIIADGLRGASASRVDINQKYIQSAYVAQEIRQSDVLLGIAHFTGHELTGFGGALKNIGMGCASRKGKLEQHSGLSPKVKRKRCKGCGQCAEHCPQSAINITDGKSFLNPEVCSGCGQCVIVCPEDAIKIRWSKDIVLFQKKMAEYALAACEGKEGKVFFLNFLTDISPGCDCNTYSDAPIVPDIGILASNDPVAIDQASVDLVNLRQGRDSPNLTFERTSGNDKFRRLYPEIDWALPLAHAESIGLGTRQYELISVS
jgi:uncharacterized Fe-S center protein